MVTFSHFLGNIERKTLETRILTVHSQRSVSGRPKSAKIPTSLYDWGGAGDELFPTFDADSKSAKIPNSLNNGGRGCGRVKKHELFPTLMLTPNLLRSQIPYTIGGGGTSDLL